MKTWLVGPALAVVGALGIAFGGPPGDGPVTVTGTTLEPTPLAFQEVLLKRLKVPSGFSIKVWAKDLKNARWMQVMPNGDVYLSRREQGDILLLRDKNRDGVVDARMTVALNIKLAHGLAVRDGKLYIVADHFVYTAKIRYDGTLDTPQAIISDLPDSGQHTARTIGFGPDGMMYISVGSTCNNCQDSNPENATLVRAMPDGSGRNVYAKGLRHLVGFGWHPVTKELWGFDHGSDWRGDDQPPEEFNRVILNGHYGWPYCYANRQVDRVAYFDPPNSTKAAFCPTTIGSTLTYTAHAAPIGFTFYRANPATQASFPASFQNDAFAGMRGSWNRSQPSGYEVVRVRFNEKNQPVAIEPFVTGWLIPANEVSAATLNQASTTADTTTASSDASVTTSGVDVGAKAATPAEKEEAVRPAQFGRIAGVPVWTDGSLLIAEDQNGIIYRVIYTGK